MEGWQEIIKIFSTGVTAAGVMGLWIYNLLEEKKSIKTENTESLKALRSRNDTLTDYIKESDKANLQLLTEMRMLITTLTANQEKLPAAIRDIIKSEVSLIKQTLDAVQSNINRRSP